MKLIDRINKDNNIYFEINNGLSDFSNDSNKRTVQQTNISGETTTNQK